MVKMVSKVAVNSLILAKDMMGIIRGVRGSVSKTVRDALEGRYDEIRGNLTAAVMDPELHKAVRNEQAGSK